eukprot:1117482-Alexandrium_andersonii.AAC.1
MRSFLARRKHAFARPRCAMSAWNSLRSARARATAAGRVGVSMVRATRRSSGGGSQPRPSRGSGSAGAQPVR